MGDIRDPRFFEDVLIKFMYTDVDVREKILPFIKAELFDRHANVSIYKHIFNFMDRYSKFPTVQESKLDIEDEKVYEHLLVIMDIDLTEYTKDFILGEIELFLKKKLIYNICTSAVVNLDETSGLNPKPVDDLREAYAFSFDTKIGMDVFDEEQRMYDFFHTDKNYIETNIPNFDRLIDGGFHSKTLNLVLAATNVGKSLIMASLATSQLFANKNVLYISCEMSEEKIGERILANAFDVPLSNLKRLTKTEFHLKYDILKKRLSHKFVLKEYPPGVLNANHIRNLLKDLESKKKFVPDIVYVDYLGLMAPNHSNKNGNQHEALKRVSEELRAIAVEKELPIVSAIQTNRGGINSSTVDIDDTAESIGITFTADLIWAASQSEELLKVGKYLWTIVKNRYGQKKIRFTVNVDYDYMRITYDPDSDVDYQDKNVRPPLNSEERDTVVDEMLSVKKSFNKKNDQIEKKQFIDFE